MTALWDGEELAQGQSNGIRKMKVDLRDPTWKKNNEWLCFSIDALAVTIKWCLRCWVWVTYWKPAEGEWQEVSSCWAVEVPVHMRFLCATESFLHREHSTGKTSVLRASGTLCWKLMSFTNTLLLLYLGFFFFVGKPSYKGLIEIIHFKTIITDDRADSLICIKSFWVSLHHQLPMW